MSKKLLGVHEVPAGSELRVKQEGAEGQADNSYELAIMDADGKIMKAHANHKVIRGEDIKDDAIDSQHLAAASIDTEHIGQLQVTQEKLAGNSVSTAKIVDGDVTTAKLDGAAVTTAKIADANVTLAKMAADSVDSDQYVDGSIDTAHIADAQITLAKMATNSVDSDQYVDGSLDYEHLSAGIIADHTNLGSAAADADEILLSVTGSGSPLNKTISADLPHKVNTNNTGMSIAHYTSFLYVDLNSGWSAAGQPDSDIYNAQVGALFKFTVTSDHTVNGNVVAAAGDYYFRVTGARTNDANGYGEVVPVSFDASLSQASSFSINWANFKLSNNFTFTPPAASLKALTMAKLRETMGAGSVLGGDGITVSTLAGVNTVAADLKASGGLKIDNAEIMVEPADFAGAGLEDDGSDKMAIKLREHNVGQSDSGLEVSADGLRIKENEVTQAMLAADKLMSFTDDAGNSDDVALDGSFEFEEGRAMGITVSSGKATFDADLATAAAVGVASFDSGDFDVSVAGAVTLADSASGAVLQISGTANEVTAQRTDGGVTLSLPDDVTIGQDLTVSRNLSVTGDLTVNGGQFEVQGTTVKFTDNLLDMGLEDDSINGGTKLPTSASTKDQGLVFNRYDGSNNSKEAFYWDESEDEFKLETAVTEGTGAQAGIISGGSTADLVANLKGGDVKASDNTVLIDESEKSAAFAGGVTADVTGDLTGNADSATQLATARNFSMAGDVVAPAVSFDGTGNVVLQGTIQANSVEGSMIADDAIDSRHYTDGSIDSAHYAAGSVNTAALGNLQVTTGKLAADAVDGSKIADNAIDSEHIAAGSIDRAHLAADIVDGSKIADDSIDSEHLVADSIDSEHYAPGSVDTTALGAGSVTNAKLGADAVDGSKIADDSIDSEHLAAGSIDSEHFAAGSVNTAALADDSVSLAKLANGSRAGEIISWIDTDGNGSPDAWSRVRPYLMAEFQVDFSATGDASEPSADVAGNAYSLPSWVSKFSTANDPKLGMFEIKLSNSDLFGNGSGNLQGPCQFLSQVFIVDDAGNVQELAGTNLMIVQSGQTAYAYLDLDGAAQGTVKKIRVGFMQIGSPLLNS